MEAAKAIRYLGFTVMFAATLCTKWEGSLFFGWETKLLKALLHVMNESDDPEAQEQAVLAMHNLGTECGDTLVEDADIFHSLLQLVQKGGTRSAEWNAAGVFYTALEGHPERTDQKSPAEWGELLQALVQMLAEGAKEEKEGDPRGQEYGALAILSLAQSTQVASHMLRERKVLPAILTLFQEGSPDGKEYAARVLQLLAAVDIGALAFDKEKLVAAAAEVLKSGSRDAKKETSKLIGQLCKKEHKYLKFEMDRAKIRCEEHSTASSLKLSLCTGLFLLVAWFQGGQ